MIIVPSHVAVPPPPSGPTTIPTLAATWHSTSTAGSGSTITMTRPTVSTGDLMIAIASWNGSGTPNAPTNGFSLAPNSPVTQVTGAYMAIWWKIATASEPSTYSFTLGRSTNNIASASILVFSGASSTPFNATARGGTQSFASTFPAATMTTTSRYYWLIVGTSSTANTIVSSSLSNNGLTLISHNNTGATNNLATVRLTTPNTTNSSTYDTPQTSQPTALTNIAWTNTSSVLAASWTAALVAPS